MIKNIDGIIITYRSMQGVILLRRQDVPSLEALAEIYSCSTCDDGFWFAKFKWSSIDEDTRRYISKNQKDPNDNHFVDETLMGQPVVCSIEQTPKWEALNVRVRLTSRPFHVKKRIRQYKIKGSKKRHKPLNAAEQRYARSIIKKPNNVRKPWRG